MAALGMMSLEGRGLPRDQGRARLVRDRRLRSASRWRPTISPSCSSTRGAPEDIARAARLLVIAAEAEVAEAQHALGVMHSRGQGGIAHDKAEAARLYLRATYNGSIAGEVEYAIVAFNGEAWRKTRSWPPGISAMRQRAATPSPETAWHASTYSDAGWPKKWSKLSPGT